MPALAGSHRLVAARAMELRAATTTSSAPVDALDEGAPWLHDVYWPGAEPERTQRLLGAEAVVDGVPVRVVELTGRRGDVVLTHMDVLHTAAPNTRPTPRLMLGKNIVRTCPTASDLRDHQSAVG